MEGVRDDGSDPFGEGGLLRVGHDSHMVSRADVFSVGWCELIRSNSVGDRVLYMETENDLGR